MATTRILNIGDLHPVLRRIDNFNGQLTEQFAATMWASVLDMEREVVERTPVGTGYSPTGNLRGSIFSEVYGTPVGLYGAVATPALYGICVELGTKPHWPPPGALTDWVRLVLGVEEDEVPSVEFLIRRKIARVGTDGQLMFEKGYQASEPKILRMFLAAFRRVAKAIGGGS